MGRRKRLVIGLLVAVVLVVPAVILLEHWMNGSSTGNIHVGNPASQSQPAGTKPLTITTPYFTTTLPAGFNLKSQTVTPNAPQTQLQLLADSSSQIDQQFSASVGVIPAEGLRSVGDYNLRLSAPAIYTPFLPTSLPAGATAFRTTGGPAAFTVFWPRGDHYTEVTLSTDGGASLDQLVSVYSQVMANWTWL